MDNKEALLQFINKEINSVSQRIEQDSEYITLIVPPYCKGFAIVALNVFEPDGKLTAHTKDYIEQFIAISLEGL